MRPYIDVHCHIGSTVSRSPSVGQSVGRYMARMASAGVTAAILSPTAGGPQAHGVRDTRRQNEEVARACQAFPDRFPLGLAGVEVRHEGAGVDELRRAMMDDGLVGFMCHPALSGHSLGAELHPFLEVVAEGSGLCLLHQAGSTANIAAYARRFPTIIFIIGHVSMNRQTHDDAIRQCADIANVWYDIAQKPTPDEPEWGLPHLLGGLAADRVMFGSDAPYYDFRLVQRLVEDADIDHTAKDGIAHGAATRLIRSLLPEWEPPTGALHPPQRYTDDEMWAARGPRLL
ncbi:amidohydrolase family protein [Candidatus Poribacteria bacterium]|nr:amidohydrolase family protein [Candidatus Poribacteria bacterium]MBT5536548.1 amidohydrolase family protein [Candidatus Poribacteria bacterium]MBT5711731.1 amidohydrolase family protein [Candidatus Poribacteria bacterium]MBT7804763.1 amidohydrolase family protein [Candidatus Poribacteria bacterium]